VIAELIAGLIKGLYDIIRNYVQASSCRDSLHDHIIRNESIQAVLTELLRKTQADRVYIILFHNGGRYYSGNSMQRVSCIYEVVGNGIAPIMGKLQNRLVSEFPHLHNTLLRENEYSVSDVNQLAVDDPLKPKWLEHGTQSLYIAGLRDLNGTLVGDIAINYLIPTSITDDVKKEVKNFANASVGYILPTRQQTEDFIAKTIILFIGVMFLSQFFYFLTNLVQFFDSLGPLVKSIVKAVIDIL
jgi:hypothetical protein